MGDGIRSPDTRTSIIKSSKGARHYGGAGVRAVRSRFPASQACAPAELDAKVGSYHKPETLNPKPKTLNPKPPHGG